MVLSGGGVQAGAALDAKIPRRLAGLEGFWVFFAALHAHGVLALHVRLGLFQAHFVGLCRQAAPAAAQYAREHGVGGVGERRCMMATSRSVQRSLPAVPLRLLFMGVKKPARGGLVMMVFVTSFVS